MEVRKGKRSNKATQEQGATSKKRNIGSETDKQKEREKYDRRNLTGDEHIRHTQASEDGCGPKVKEPELKLDTCKANARKEGEAPKRTSRKREKKTESRTESIKLGNRQIERQENPQGKGR